MLVATPVICWPCALAWRSRPGFSAKPAPNCRAARNSALGTLPAAPEHAIIGVRIGGVFVFQQESEHSDRNQITANAKLVMVCASCLLLNGGAASCELGRVNGGTGAKTWLAMAEQRCCANFVKKFQGLRPLIDPVFT
jgi:hypothetical protein